MVQIDIFYRTNKTSNCFLFITDEKVNMYLVAEDKLCQGDNRCVGLISKKDDQRLQWNIECQIQI